MQLGTLLVLLFVGDLIPSPLAGLTRRWKESANTDEVQRLVRATLRLELRQEVTSRELTPSRILVFHSAQEVLN